MPQFILDHGSPDAARSFSKLDAFTQGYIEAMFFTDTGDMDDGDLKDATVADLANETLERIITDCLMFQKINALLIDQACSFFEYDTCQAGRDFWYTRNGHGCGFWDRDLHNEEIGNIGGELSDACGWGTEFGGVDVYLGDDDQIYLM